MIAAERPPDVEQLPPPLETANPTELDSAGLRTKPAWKRFRWIAYALAAMIALDLGLGTRWYLERRAAVEAAGIELNSVVSRGSLKSTRLYDFRLRTQSLQEALFAWTRTTGLEFIAAPGLDCYITAPLIGSFTSAEALAQLMSGTECQAEALDDGAVQIICKADLVVATPPIPKFKFNVPTMPMRDALVRFIGQANSQRYRKEVAIQGAYFCEQGPECFDFTRNQKANNFTLPVCSKPVIGEFTFEEALKQMSRDTGLAVSSSLQFWNDKRASTISVIPTSGANRKLLTPGRLWWFARKSPDC